jgi:hypothetical protein
LAANTWQETECRVVWRATNGAYWYLLAQKPDIFRDIVHLLELGSELL